MGEEMSKNETFILLGNEYSMPPVAMAIVGVILFPVLLFVGGVVFIAMLLSCIGGCNGVDRS